jgi:hypothetical protein
VPRDFGIGVIGLDRIVTFNTSPPRLVSVPLIEVARRDPRRVVSNSPSTAFF